MLPFMYGVEPILSRDVSVVPTEGCVRRRTTAPARRGGPGTIAELLFVRWDIDSSDETSISWLVCLLYLQYDVHGGYPT